MSEGSSHTLCLDSMFDRIVLLTLQENAHKRTRIRGQFAKYGGTIQNFMVGTGDGECGENEPQYEDVRPPKAWKGTAQSFNHYCCFHAIVESAANDGVSYLLFLEDDVVLLPNFAPTLIAAWKYVVDNGWDMLYFGCNNQGPFRHVHPFLIKLTLALGMHAVAIHRTMFEALLELDPRKNDGLYENPYLDVTIAHLYHKQRACYALNPSVAIQDNKDVGRWQHIKKGLI